MMAARVPRTMSNRRRIFMSFSFLAGIIAPAVERVEALIIFAPSAFGGGGKVVDYRQNVGKNVLRNVSMINAKTK